MNDDGLDMELDDGPPKREGPSPLDWALLILRAARRRWVLAVGVFLAGLGACAAWYHFKQPTYRVEAVILTQRQPLLPSSMRAPMEESPTQSAWEIVHRRENLLALLAAAGLVERPRPAEKAPASDVGAPPPLLANPELQPAPAADPATQAPVASAQDRRMPPGLRLGGDDDDDPRELLLRKLDKSLKVSTEEGTITISLDWPDARQAYRIVDGAVQNFIEARHIQEVTAIDEVISVLRGRVATARDNFDRIYSQAHAGRAALTQGRVVARPRPSEESIKLRSLLESKERAIQDIEDFRRRRLADLQAQLDAARGVYSDAHPSIQGLQQDIQALSRESPQTTALRAEVEQLRKDYQARFGAEAAGTGEAAPVVYAPATNPAEDDERVREARFQYQTITERVNAAELELDAVRAGFKYRYNLVWPPQEPKDPISPDPRKIFGLGLMASLALGLAAAALPDLRSGRIVERWQVEKQLGLPVITELRDR